VMQEDAESEGMDDFIHGFPARPSPPWFWICLLG